MASSNQKRLRITVFGRVQGVGYRYFCHENAENLCLSGWVHNRCDRTVELEVQGDRDSISTFVIQLREGPRLSHVTNVQFSEIPVQTGDSDFVIRY